MADDPIRLIIGKPLADYDAILSERPKLRAALDAFNDALEWNTEEEYVGAVHAAIAAGPAPDGQTPTPSQAVAAEFLAVQADLTRIGDSAVLCLHQCLALARRPQPCAVSAVFTDAKTYQNLTGGVVS